MTFQVRHIKTRYTSGNSNKESIGLQAVACFSKQAPKGVLENSFPENFEKVSRKTSVMKSFLFENGCVTDSFNKKIK